MISLMCGIKKKRTIKLIDYGDDGSLRPGKNIHGVRGNLDH